MSDLNFKARLDTSEVDEKIRKLHNQINDAITKQTKSSSDASSTTVINSATEATKKLKEAQLANIESIRRTREERAKEISSLNVLKQAEQEAKNALAEKRAELAKYALEQRKSSDEQKKATEEERKATRAAKEAERARKQAERELAKQNREAEKRRKQLEKESSEYYKLNRALGDVRKRAKDVGAEMFRMELQGKKNTAAYEALRKKFENLSKQTNILDTGIKKIDASLGLHQRNVGNYTQATERMIPIVGRINSQLAGFGLTLDDLAKKPNAIRELGLAFIGLGKSILSFLVSPIGLAITAVASFFMLFQRNKQTVIDFNSGLLNVSKTTGIAGADLDKLSDSVIKLSRSLQTVSTDKLLQYATVAGQLGVKGTENILAFTEALAKLETASDISGEEGGAEIARLLTLTDGGVQNVKKFGDEIVNLGNNFAATEKEILANAEAIAQNTGLFKIGRQDVLAYATATKSVGLEAEVVGSSFFRTLTRLGEFSNGVKGSDRVLKMLGVTQEDLRKRFKNDASGVFLDFVRSLNKIDKAGGDVDVTLKELGLRNVRDIRVLGTLASSGYGQLERAMINVRDAAGAMDEEFQTKAASLANQTNRIGIAWDNLVLSIENGQGAIGKASVAVVGFFADILEAVTPNTSASDALTSSYENQKIEIESLEKKISPLITQYNSLKDKGELNTREQTSLKKVIGEIAQLIPGVVTEWDRYGNALEVNSEKVMGLSTAYQQLLKDMNISVIDDLNKQFKESEKWVNFYEKNLNEVASNDNITFLFTTREKSVKQWTESLANANHESLQIIKNLQKVGAALTDEQRKILEGYGLIAEGSVPLDVELPERFKKNRSLGKELSFSEELGLISNKAERDSIKKSTQEKMEALSPTDPQISEYKKQLSEIAKLEEAYSVGSKSKQIDRSSEQRRQAIERQRALQLQIDQINQQSLRGQLSKDEQEVASIRDKYAKIREEVRKFYADPKNKGLRVNMSGVDQAESFEISEAETRRETSRLVDRLNKQKAIYDEYNNYVEQSGIEAADKLFGKQAEIAKSYRSDLDDEYFSLLGKQKTASTGGSGVAQFTQAEEERLKQLQAMRDAEAKNEEVKTRSRMDEALKMAQSFNDKRLEIERKYQQARDALGDNITPEQEQELERQESKDLSQLATEELSQSDAWQKLFSDLDALTVSQIDKLVKEIDSKFDSLSGTFDPIDLAAIRKRLNEARDMIIADNPFKQVGVAMGEIFKSSSKDSKSNAEDIKRNWNNLAKATEESFQFVADAVSSAGFLKDAIGEIGHTALMSLTAVATTAIAVATAIKTAEKASVILAIIQAALVVVNAIAGLFKSIFNAGDKRLEKSIESKRKSVEELDRAFQQLERSMNRAAGSDYYKTGEQQIANLKEQLRITEQMVRDEEAKKKTDNDKVQDYKDQIQSIGNQIEDVQQQLVDTLLQSTFRDLADDLADALVSAMQEGENAISGLNDAYDDFIKNAIINQAKMNFLEPTIKEMMAQAEKYAKDNDYSLDGFNFNAWREAIEGAGGKFIENVEGMFGGLGLDLGEATSSLKSEGISRELTEQTGNEIVGMYRAGYDIWKQQLATAQAQTATQKGILALANDKLIALNAIQVNTANTVNRLDVAITYLKHLKTIDSNLGGRYAG